MNTKLRTACDGRRLELNLFMTAGQVSDRIGARTLMGSLPKVDELLGDRGCDDDWFLGALKNNGVRACIRGNKQRKKPVKTLLVF